MRLTALILAGILILPLPARGHTTEEKSEWMATWTSNALRDGYLSTGEVAELIEFKERHRPPIRLPAQASPPRKPPSSTWSIEQWIPLLQAHFLPSDLEWAKRVMWCESRGDPTAVSPTNDHGLFQHHLPYWPDRSAKAGIPGGDVYDPETNVRVAAWLYYTQGPQHWACK